MKAKANTLIERQGFKDDDRTPMHDEIQLWLLKNVKQIIKANYPFKKISGIDVKLEYPVVSEGYKSSYVVGAIDAVIIVDADNQRNAFLVEIKSKIVSFGDLVRQINFYKSHMETPKYMYNNKDLNYCETINFVVVSPDDRFKEVLKSQDIDFIKYPTKFK